MFKAITNMELRDKIVELALQQWHKEYKHGAHGPYEFDCAGFVWYVYHEIMGINIYDGGAGLSTTTRIMKSNYGTIITFDEGVLDKDLTLINKGDIVFFHRQSKEENEPKSTNKYPGHCGIYLGDKRFIHAPSTKGKIIINDFTKSEYWTKKLVASKNIIKD